MSSINSRTNGLQSAEIGTKSPEIVPNGVRQTFPIVIAEWDRNSREVVRVALDRFNGKHTINIRVWYRDGGELRPSKSGLTLALRHLELMVVAMGSALDVARNLGLIEEGGEQ